MSRLRARSAVVLCLFLGSLAPGTLRAQSAENAAAAESLFREARNLMAEERYEEACPKLEASQRLDPGLGTLLNLADCNDKLGKTASAWAQFLEAATLARRSGAADRARVATDRARALEPRLMRLRLLVPAHVRVRGLEIRRDGVLVDEATWGSATPIDPGPHLVTLTAPGKREWSKAVTVQGEGATVDLEVGPMEDAPAASATPTVTETPSGGPAAPPLREREGGEGRGSAQRTVGVVLGVVGLVGLGAGSYFGLSAQKKWADADCPDLRCKTSADQELSKDAKTSADLSTVAFVGGGALVAIGGVLWLTAPSGAEGSAGPRTRRGLALAPAITPGGGSVELLGRF